MVEYYRKRCELHPDFLPTGKKSEWKRRVKPFRVRSAGGVWTEDEIKIIQAVYPTGGATMVKMYTARSLDAIKIKARRLKLTRGRWFV